MVTTIINIKGIKHCASYVEVRLRHDGIRSNVNFKHYKDLCVAKDGKINYKESVKHVQKSIDDMIEALIDLRINPDKLIDGENQDE